MSAAVFKRWFVKRPSGGCQVLFPLTELDGLVQAVLARERKRMEALVTAAIAAEDALRAVIDAKAFPEAGTPYNIANSEAREALPALRRALNELRKDSR